MWLIRRFILFVFITNISKASEDALEKINDDLHSIFTEQNPWEAKLSEDLRNFKIESIGKLNNIKQEITEHFDDTINNKLKALERSLPTKLEEYLDNKFNLLEEKHKKMEINIIERIESYVDTKIKLLEKHISRDIAALQESIPDKADITIINNKLNAVKKIQLDSCGNNTSQLKEPNDISRIIELALDKKLSHVENSLTDITNTCLKPVTLENNFKKLEDNLKNLSPELQSIKQKLDTLNTKSVNELNENKLISKLDELNMQISYLNNTLTNESNTIYNFKQHFDAEMFEMTKKVPQLEENINKKINALQTIEETVLDEIHRTECKELYTHKNYYFIPFFNIYNKSLKHVVLRNNSNSIEYFEIHFAIMSDPEQIPFIILSPTNTLKNETDFTMEIGFPRGKVLLHKQRKVVASKHISTNLSSRQFTGFYIKIENDKLEFGTGNTPLLTYSEPLLKTIKYFSYSSSKAGITRFLYDCPSNSFITSM